MIAAVNDGPEPLVRVNANLASGANLTVQVNNIDKSERSPAFRGCIFAVDIFVKFSEAGRLGLDEIKMI